MSVAFRRAKVYVRGTLIGLMALAIALVLLKNYGNEVSVWFFGLTDPSKPVNVVWLMFAVMGATLWARWVFSLGWGLWRDVREMQKQRVIDAAARKVEQREARLNERERNIDEKLRRIAGGEGLGAAGPRAAGQRPDEEKDDD